MSTELQKDYQRFAQDAKHIVKDRVYTDYLRRYAYGVDASCYHYVPEVVVKANSEEEVIKLIRLANQCGTPVSFRAAGSSLSGQSSCKDVLIVANDGFKRIEVLGNGEAIRVDCGVIGSDANDALKPFNRKLGPDPATITTALVGGILNNNSSGMCCGIAQNSYQTIQSLRVILVDGTVLDTGNRKSVEAFLQARPDIVEGLNKIRADIMEDQELVDMIKRKYKIKNTTGYGLNSLVDFDEIVDILNHIFIGSEGTIGFLHRLQHRRRCT